MHITPQRLEALLSPIDQMISKIKDNRFPDYEFDKVYAHIYHMNYFWKTKK